MPLIAPRYARSLLILTTAFISYASAYPTLHTPPNVHASPAIETQQNANSTGAIAQYGETTFASEPRGRGTIGILVSCTTTFIFCIWTTAHPNIIPGLTWYQRTYYKLMLMLLSIVIPESLVICAMAEFREARRIVEAWKARLPKDPAQDSYVDFEVAYFVVMGGFVAPKPGKSQPQVTVQTKTEGIESEGAESSKHAQIEASETISESGSSDQGTHSRRLTPAGFRRLLNERRITSESFDKKAVTDKGNASTFGKVVAILQASWLVVQSLVRLHSGLPLSLLEVHVLIHVIRAAILYILWWKKPLDVNEPIEIKLEGEGSSSKGNNTISGADPGDKTSCEGGKAPDAKLSIIEIPITPDSASPPPADKATPTKDFIKERIPETPLRICIKAVYDIFIQLDWAGREKQEEKGKEEVGDKNGCGEREATPLSAHVVNLAIFLQSLMAGLNGALHAVVWNKKFASSVERWLWRASALTICVCCLGIFLIANFSGTQDGLLSTLWVYLNETPDGFPKNLRRPFAYIHRIAGRKDGKNENQQSISGYLFRLYLIFLLLLLSLGYFYSILYITVESYLDLREAPVELWRTPTWSAYWPHV